MRYRRKSLTHNNQYQVISKSYVSSSKRSTLYTHHHTLYYYTTYRALYEIHTTNYVYDYFFFRFSLREEEKPPLYFSSYIIYNIYIYIFSSLTTTMSSKKTGSCFDTTVLNTFARPGAHKTNKKEVDVSAFSFVRKQRKTSPGEFLMKGKLFSLVHLSLPPLFFFSLHAHTLHSFSVSVLFSFLKQYTLTNTHRSSKH